MASKSVQLEFIHPLAKCCVLFYLLIAKITGFLYSFWRYHCLERYEATKENSKQNIFFCINNRVFNNPC